MKHIKCLLAFIALILIFSTNTFAQKLSDLPADPGGNIHTYENGYADGAIAAANLKTELAPLYNNFILSFDWFLYNNSSVGHLGQKVEFDSEGIKLPIVKWMSKPSAKFFEDRTAYKLMEKLRQQERNSDFDAGYYEGFLDYWFEH